MLNVYVCVVCKFYCAIGAELATVTKSMTLPDVHVEFGGLEADEKYSVFVRGVSAHSHSPSVSIPIRTGGNFTLGLFPSPRSSVF